MKIYEVKTHGGQIIADQQPKEIEVTAQFEPLVRLAFEQTKLGYSFMSGAKYYDTEAHARHAIDWALSN